jgi:hypothetical protein
VFNINSLELLSSTYWRSISPREVKLDYRAEGQISKILLPMQGLAISSTCMYLQLYNLQVVMIFSNRELGMRVYIKIVMIMVLQQ